MDDEIKHFVTQICPCVKRKKPHIMKAAAMQSIATSESLEIIYMDFLHLDKSSVGYQYLLVVTDLFTKFTKVYATRNKEGKTAAERFYNHLILKFGLPGKILHDQGKEYVTISSNTLHNSVTLKQFELQCTTLRPMAKQRG